MDPNVVHLMNLEQALTSLCNADWACAKKDGQSEVTITLINGEVFVISKRLVGWSAKMELRTKGVLLLEAYVVPHRGQADTNLMNIWNRIYDETVQAEYDGVDFIRTSSYKLIEELAIKL